MARVDHHAIALRVVQRQRYAIVARSASVASWLPVSELLSRIDIHVAAAGIAAVGREQERAPAPHGAAKPGPEVSIDLPGDTGAAKGVGAQAVEVDKGVVWIAQRVHTTQNTRFWLSLMPRGTLPRATGIEIIYRVLGNAVQLVRRESRTN